MYHAVTRQPYHQRGPSIHAAEGRHQVRTPPLRWAEERKSKFAHNIRRSPHTRQGLTWFPPRGGTRKVFSGFFALLLTLGSGHARHEREKKRDRSSPRSWQLNSLHTSTARSCAKLSSPSSAQDRCGRSPRHGSHLRVETSMSSSTTRLGGCSSMQGLV